VSLLKILVVIALVDYAPDFIQHGQLPLPELMPFSRRARRLA